jgi:hypothetical protein
MIFSGARRAVYQNAGESASSIVPIARKCCSFRCIQRNQGHQIILHLSKDEQRKRLLDRIDVPDKNWKFSLADIHERK